MMVGDVFEKSWQDLTRGKWYVIHGVSGTDRESADGAVNKTDRSPCPWEIPAWQRKIETSIEFTPHVVPRSSHGGHQNSRAIAGAIHGKSVAAFLVKDRKAVSCPVTKSHLNTASAPWLQHTQQETMPWLLLLPMMEAYSSRTSV